MLVYPAENIVLVRSRGCQGVVLNHSADGEAGEVGRSME